MSVEILNTDVFSGLASLPANSIDCVVTSPPYWGLRDYGTAVWKGGNPDCDHRVIDHPSQCEFCGAVCEDAQIGLEPTFQEHIEVLVRVFREVRRVLKPEGTLWLNYGDSYATSPNGNTHVLHNGRVKSSRDDRTHTTKPFSTIVGGLKRKDLCMIPARLAIALCDDGWWLRANNIWVKPNPKPESIKDRPSQAYEHVFLLTKSERYFYDGDAVREPHATPPKSRALKHGKKALRGQATLRPRGKLEASSPPEQRYYHEAGRSLRNVWVIPTEPYAAAHFATMPTRLAELCIKAGCPDGGLVLDPFGGAGSTAIAADRLGRRALLLELNPDYCRLAEERLGRDRLKRGEATMADVARANLPPTPLEAYIAEACSDNRPSPQLLELA